MFFRLRKSLSIKDLRLRPMGGLRKLLPVNDLVLAKAFVAEPAAVLVDLAREVVLLQLAGVDPVAVVSLNGRGRSLLVEPIYMM